MFALCRLAPFLRFYGMLCPSPCRACPQFAVAAFCTQRALLNFIFPLPLVTRYRTCTRSSIHHPPRNEAQFGVISYYNISHLARTAYRACRLPRMAPVGRHSYSSPRSQVLSVSRRLVVFSCSSCRPVPNPLHGKRRRGTSPTIAVAARFASNVCAACFGRSI